MFTGIIEEQGTIKSILVHGKTIKLSISAAKVLEDVNLGDSIAINGVCLTVTDFDEHSFQVDVMPETFKTTSLANLSQGAYVNLERAMAANGRFGGHFVTGHVDCTGEIIKRTIRENATYLSISFDNDDSHLLLDRGSVALDGTSLTIFEKNENSFTISLIPHTSEHSLLGRKRVGDLVNIEFDMLGKYIYSHISTIGNTTHHDSRITKEFLLENGF